MDSRCCCSGSSERPRSRSSETPVQSAPSTVIPDQSEGKTGLLPGALAKPLAASLPSVSTPPPPYSPPAGCHLQLGGQLPRGLLLTSIPHISMPPGLPLAVGAGSACTLGNRDLLGIVTPRMTCGQWEAGLVGWISRPHGSWVRQFWSVWSQGSLEGPSSLLSCPEQEPAYPHAPSPNAHWDSLEAPT